MPALTVFVDYNNVEQNLTAAGPFALAKLLVSTIPTSISSRFDEIFVRLYGGWRSGGNLTKHAQNLIPDIRINTPTFVPIKHNGSVKQARLIIALADQPIGSTALLEETYVKDRDLRRFRIRNNPWTQCTTPQQCGFHQFAGFTHATPCGNNSCSAKLADLFIRDEQKMVDTSMVADIAHQALTEKATDIVVVSSDTDMWPGVFLALRAGCFVTHIHTKPGLKTQRHLINMLGSQTQKFYQQMGI